MTTKIRQPEIAGHITGVQFRFPVKTVTVSSITANKGDFCSKSPGGAFIKMVTFDGTVPLFGQFLHDVATTDTSAQVQLIPSGTIMRFASSEILDAGTTAVLKLTSTGIDATSLIDAGWVTGAANAFVGAVFTCLAATNITVGDTATVTASTAAGDFTVADMGADGASGDTWKLTSLPTQAALAGDTYATPYYHSTYGLGLSYGSGGSRFCKILDIIDDSTAFEAVILNGFDGNIISAVS